MVGRVSSWHWRAIAVSAPPCILVAGLATALVLSCVGRNPIWPDHNLTLSEAVAATDDAEVELLIAAGADLSAAYDVRPGLLSDQRERVTPLESAVVSRRADLVERFLQNGAVVDAATWNRLVCLAGDAAVSAVLDRYRPADAIRNCDAVQ
jgi:hypothetical protein